MSIFRSPWPISPVICLLQKLFSALAISSGRALKAGALPFVCQRVHDHKLQLLKIEYVPLQFFTLQVCFLLFSKIPSCFSITLYLLALCWSIHLVSILILSIATLSIVIKLRYCPLSSNCSFVAGHWLSVLFLRFCFGKRVQDGSHFHTKGIYFFNFKGPEQNIQFFYN